MKKKKYILLVVVLIGIIAITGISYAVWQLMRTQEGVNVLNSTCFKIEFESHDDINLLNAYPIKDEEGMKLTPYTFTIRNICNTNATYQINLEELETTLKRLPNQYIKVSLNEGNGKLLNSYEEVEKTISNANQAFKLTTGVLKSNEEKTFTLRLWMDYDTPAIEEVMEATFGGKVSIIATHLVDLDPPKVIATTSNELRSITVDASDSFDEITRIGTYYFRLKEQEWKESKEPIYTFTDLDYQKYTIEVQVEDQVGNKSEVKNVEEFPKVLATEYVNTLNGNGEVLNDGTVDNNMRYIGKNPKNYIDIGDRDANGNTILWRIIGAMNHVHSSESDSNGESRLKIVRDESIGNYSWDSSLSNINIGWGINEWSQADAKTLLNDYYYNSKPNEICFNGINNASISCDFSSIGLSSTSISYISDALWNLGANPNASTCSNDTTCNQFKANQFYEFERGNVTGKSCTSSTQCNDIIPRTLFWIGAVGLIYPSDFGYATSGSLDTSRDTCLNTLLYAWSNTSIPDCKNNDWLYKKEIQWTMTPFAFKDHARAIFRIVAQGSVHNYYGAESGALYPSLYLKGNVKIFQGNGSKSFPFQISL